MAKKIDGYIKLQIAAGQANPSPPVGPALGQKELILWSFVKHLMHQSNGSWNAYSSCHNCLR